MNRRIGSLVNPRIMVLVVVLVVGVSLAGHGAFSQASPSSNRKAINLPDERLHGHRGVHHEILCAVIKQE
jgi:hypothetical protein